MFPKKIEDKFTSNLKNVLLFAENLAKKMSHSEISIHHILFSIASQGGSLGANVLGESRINLQALQAAMEGADFNDVERVKPRNSISFASHMKPIFQNMVLCANNYNHAYIGTEHLLYAIVSQQDDIIIQVFKEAEIDSTKLLEKVEAIMESTYRFTGMLKMSDDRRGAGDSSLFNLSNLGTSLNPMEGMQAGVMNSPVVMNKSSAIETFCVDINEQVENKKFDTIIGRDKEIAKLVNILSRKSKNNPILIGEPGVGKTAIVQGLVQKILLGEVPSNLSHKKVYSLDLGLLIAGTVFRGEFEARLKDVIAEVGDNPDIILFIDEIHTIIGAGNTSGAGSLDAANILKPPLSRGEISCIGATTIEEYRKHFKKDAALDRRFQMILVEEPSIEDAERVLLGVKPFYEKHHNLTIEREAVHSAVELSYRFINDRFLPDKALDVLDEAAALVRSRHGNKNYFKEIKVLTDKKNKLKKHKEQSAEKGDYEQALVWKKQEDEIQKEIVVLNKKQLKENTVKIKTPVTARDVGEIVGQITGVPVNSLLDEEKKQLQNLEKEIQKEIVGQDAVVKVLAKSIRRNRSGIAEGNRPLGVFMFLGPTGVGKTEMVKVLAEKVYKDKKSLIKVDMSEFMERHNVSRLVGAPAGYVGFEEGGKLTEAVRLKPYSIVLFDEIEKAHPDVFNLMLQIFEDGELTDAAGRKVDFRNTIIIMTSNLGTEELTAESGFGFATQEIPSEEQQKDEIRNRYLETKDRLLQNLKEEFRPEFLNRIDGVLVFDPLNRNDIEKILKNKLRSLQKRVWQKKRIKVEVDSKLIEFLTRISFDPNEGARLIRRNLQSLVEDVISEAIINNQYTEGEVISLGVQDEQVIIKAKKVN